MNIQEILKNPELINGLSSTEKTNLYMQLNNIKTSIDQKLLSYKAKEEVLEKQKAEIQEELFKEAGVSDMDSLIGYVKGLQTGFNTALEEQTIAISNVIDKLGL